MLGKGEKGYVMMRKKQKGRSRIMNNLFVSTGSPFHPRRFAVLAKAQSSALVR